MAQTQLLKRRIRSVLNTRQITKAMELVAASKMKRAQDAVLRSRPYIAAARNIIRKLRAVTNPELHPFFAHRAVSSELIIVIASDRGLAGAYNSAISRSFLTRLQTNQAASITTRIIAVGQKVARLASAIDSISIEGVYSNLPTEPTSLTIRPISETATRLYLNKSIDRVIAITTEFHSSLNRVVAVRQLLPIESDPSINLEHSAKEVMFEPSPEIVLNQVLPRLIEAELFQLLLEANASEHSMRMMAMKSASDNAEDLTKDLTQSYNSARQAAITQELAEISSGAAAIQE